MVFQPITLQRPLEVGDRDDGRVPYKWTPPTTVCFIMVLLSSRAVFLPHELLRVNEDTQSHTSTSYVRDLTTYAGERGKEYAY